MWEKTRKVHNLIIGVGKEDMMFYSVEYFDKNVIVYKTMHEEEQ